MRFFDLHCDTLYRAVKENKSLFKNDFNVSIEKSAMFDSYVQCFAIWIPDEIRGENAIRLFENARNKIFEEKNKSNGIDFKIYTELKCLSELSENSNKNCGAIFTVEGGAVLGGKIDNVKKIYDAGVRVMTLTWNGECEIGGGAGTDIGLTRFGRMAVQKMEDIGIIIDISHASEKLFYDVCEFSNKPFIATHSNSKSVCNHKRNLTDDQFKIIKERGGIVGITFCKYFLSDDNPGGFDNVLKHVYHFWELGGENTVAFGSDFDGCDLPSEINGLENVEDLYEYFLKKNFSQKLIDKLFFDNAHDFMIRMG